MARFQLTVDRICHSYLIADHIKTEYGFHSMESILLGDIVIGFTIHFFVELCNPINLRPVLRVFTPDLCINTLHCCIDL